MTYRPPEVRPKNPTIGSSFDILVFLCRYCFYYILHFREFVENLVLYKKLLLIVTMFRTFGGFMKIRFDSDVVFSFHVPERA